MISQVSSSTESRQTDYNDAKRRVTEMRGRKDLGKEAKKGPVRLGKKGIRWSKKGHINGEMDRNDRRDLKLERERTANSCLETKERTCR